MSTEPTTAPPVRAGERTTKQRVARFLSENGALVGLVVVCVAMWIATPDFLTTRNLLNVGVQAAVVAIPTTRRVPTVARAAASSSAKARWSSTMRTEEVPGSAGDAVGR